MEEGHRGEEREEGEGEIATRLIDFQSNIQNIFFFKDARVAKERKDRLIEEVRRHFGFKIDPRDERFKEMLELKEKAQKKALKEIKRAEKESKIMEKLVEGNKKGQPQEKAPKKNDDDDDGDDDEKKK